MALLRPLLLDNVARWAGCAVQQLVLVTAPLSKPKTQYNAICCLTVCGTVLPVLPCLSCSIQQSAALALGRLANYSDELAEAVVQNEILPQLVSWLVAWWVAAACR